MRSSGSSQKILTVRKGEELKVHVSDELCKESSFMNHAYRQALRAVAGIVQRTSEYHDEERKGCPRYSADDALLAFGSNVVAFSAQRGCGKTSTMLSFGQALEKMDARMLRDENHRFLSKRYQDGLSKVQFHVLTPVSPSVLEEQQNILYVVLARLYSYAWELLKKVECSNGSVYREHSDAMEKLEKLKREIQECYDGVLGVKQATREMPRDILELQDICDGLSLCRHFSTLVLRIVHCLGGDNHFLVLQLDDADSQVKNGFCVLEDVRKYLQVPNLIILLSADMELLHDSVRQNFQEYFPDRREDHEFEKRLIRMCRKYIDKLIPPTHLINLPQLDARVDQYADNLQLVYQEEVGEGPTANEEENWGIQDKLLLMIYQKTGVVFSKPSGHPHSIIPTTLRGLNQLLRMLTDMEDIPILKDVGCFQDPKRFTQALQKQVDIQEYNLSQFADYFSNGWIYVKVSEQKDHDFLCSLRDANGERYVSMTVDYLRKRYAVEGELIHNSVYLDALMYELQEQHNTQDDYYLLFAIRTLFSLKHHKMILAQKRDALSVFARGESSVFAVDYDPKKLHLSSSYLVNPELLDVSLGQAQSICAAKEKRWQCEREYQQWNLRHSTIQKQALAAESWYQDMQYQLADAKTSLEDVEQAVQQADTELRIAKAELKAVLDSYPVVTTTQDRAAVASARKKEAHARAVLDDAQAREKAIRRRVEDAEGNVRDAEENYRTSQRRLVDYKTEEETCSDYETAYQKAVSPFGTGGATPGFAVDEQVRPTFVVRNALHDAWDQREKQDRESMTPGKLAAKRLLFDSMVGEDQQGHSCVSFLNFVTFLLRLGAVKLSNLESVPEDAQRMVYFAQECALMIAANWEVQDRLYRKVNINFSKTGESFCHTQSSGSAEQGRQTVIWLDVLFHAVDTVLHEINDGKLFAYLHKDNTAIALNEDTYWSINSGYGLVKGNYKYYSTLLDFESALREIFDLPLIDQGEPTPKEILTEAPNPGQRTIVPDNLDDDL